MSYKAALAGLAEVEFQAGHFQLARKHAAAAVAARAGLRAELVMGNICFKLGEYATAVQMYKKVLRRHGANQEALRNLEAAQRRLSPASVTPR